MKWWIYCCLFFSSLHAEKIVQCIANYPIDPAQYTQFLQERGYEGKVIATSIKEYEKDLLYRKGYFHKLLRKLHLDYPFKVDIDENIDKIVFFNLNPNWIKKYDFSRLPKDKLILFMWEPKSVIKDMYRADVQGHFSKIYTWDDSLVDGKKYFKFYYPVLCPMLSQLPSFEERKLCTFISSNLHSDVENELYSKRKEAICYFEQVGEKEFEFYGKKWNAAEHPAYRGIAPDKMTAMKGYRTAICYENICQTQGYISEKIFDCFAAGTIPIYWGASNVETFIPQGCFIDRRQFASMQDLHAFLSALTQEDYDTYLSHIRTFLKSDDAQKFSLRTFADIFYQAITSE